MSNQRVSPAVLKPLKEALSLAYWYKPDLRSFLVSATGERQLIAALDWTDYKRAIVGQLVDTLAAGQDRYFDTLLNLLLATAEITDPAHLKRLDDGQEKYARAVEALDTLRRQVEPYQKARSAEEEARNRREVERAAQEIRRAVADKLEELRTTFLSIIQFDPQRRGYELESFLNQLFALFDIDSKRTLKHLGEQIDGAFSFDGTEFIVEAKWHKELTPPSDLDVFAGKIGRKLENTLGLFVSMSGFQPSAIDLHSQARPSFILMDGADLYAVVEARISLPELLMRKKQHAARTGVVFLPVAEILGT